MKQLTKIQNIYHVLGLIPAIIAIRKRLSSKDAYYRYLKDKIYQKYKNLVLEYKNVNSQEYDFNQKKINVWTFWWQGMDELPEVVDTCLRSIVNGFDNAEYCVHIITSKNIRNFCNFPEYIYEKVEKKYITLTHFSDLVRANLLSKFGGLWIDATVYVTKKIPQTYFNNYNFFTIKISNNNKYLIDGRWTGFFIYAKKNYPLMKFLHDFFMQYWLDNDYLVEYLLIDLAIAIFIENNDIVRLDYERIPVNNVDVWYFLYQLNSCYNKNEFIKRNENTNFYKLSYKKKFIGEKLLMNANEKITNWGFLKEEIKKHEKNNL